MPRRSYRSVVIAIVVLIVFAAVIRLVGGYLWEALVAMHGGGGR
jgi:hypothetical protein